MKRGLGALALALVLAAGAVAQGRQPYSAELAAKAKAGDTAAQYALGEAYRSGNGVQADRDQAIAWFKKAAPKDTRAADVLGILLFVKGDRKQAIPLLQAASQRGEAHALYILGTARFNGDFVPRDLGAAYAEMRLAAQKGLPEAQRSLALMEPHLSAEDHIRADALAAQPMGPETGALPVPPPPVAKAKTPPPIKTVRTPMVAAASAPPVVSATAVPASPESPPIGIMAPPVIAQPTPLASIELPPSQSAPTSPAIEKPAASAAPTVVASKPISGGWRAQLAAVPSPDAAESEWKRLTKKAPDLAPLDHKAVQAGNFYRLQAIGIASKADASALCQKLVATKLGCFVLPPTP